MRLFGWSETREKKFIKLWRRYIERYTSHARPRRVDAQTFPCANILAEQSKCSGQNKWNSD